MGDVWFLPSTRFIDVSFRCRFICSLEVVVYILADPGCELDHLFAQVLDGLLIHICLSDKLREFN